MKSMSSMIQPGRSSSKVIVVAISEKRIDSASAVTSVRPANDQTIPVTSRACFGNVLIVSPDDASIVATRPSLVP